MPDTLFLLDGHSLIYQSFYALPGLLSPDGRPTGAVFGFVRVLDKILKEHAPGGVAVVLDKGGRTFRHEAYPDYKKNRKPMPDELKAQIPLILDILEARGIRILEQEGVEADDVLGTIAKRASEKGMEVVIVTRDKDLHQLLGPRVRIYDPRTDTIQDADDFRRTKGIEPARFPDLIGLAGDTSDNIPGVPGIGEKTALSLLGEFGDLEGVLAGWERIKGPKRREKIRDFAGQARLSRDLADLKTDLDVEADPQAFRLRDGEDRKVQALYRMLGFGSLVTGEKEEAGARDYETVGPSDLASLAADLRNAGTFAFDLETTGPDPIGSDLVGMSFAVEPGRARYVPIRSFGGATAVDEEEALRVLGPLLSDPDLGKIGHNLKFDATVLLRRGVPLKGIAFDTLLAAYLLNPGRRSLSLDAQAAEVLSLKTTPITALIGEGKDQKTLDLVDPEAVCAYACEDADVALRLKEALSPRLEAEGLREVFARAEMPLVGILAAMECEGVALDESALTALDREIEKRLEALEARVHDEAGEVFNLNSPKQLQTILYEKLDLPVVKRTKTGPSTDAGVLEELGRLHVLPALLSEYRGLKKLQTTYVRALPKAVHPATGRLHASFNQAVAATGRLSCSRPNLQNIPTRTETGRRIREAFHPRGGHRFLTADYSQVELRIMAHLSEDTEMVGAFGAGEDIHAAVASEIFSVGPSEVDKEMRRTAKAVNFGILYGLTAFGLSKDLGISRAEGSRFIERYFEKYAGVRRFIDEVIEGAREEGRVRTMLGRLRNLPEIRSGNRNRRLFAERTAVNTVIQGSAADLIKLAMVAVNGRVEREGWPARMLIQIHDELLYEVEAESLEEVRRGVVEEMEGVMSLHVPLKVKWAAGDNWMEL